MSSEGSAKESLGSPVLTLVRLFSKSQKKFVGRFRLLLCRENEISYYLRCTQVAPEVPLLLFLANRQRGLRGPTIIEREHISSAISNILQPKLEFRLSLWRISGK